jgi:hypothetical protein
VQIRVAGQQDRDCAHPPAGRCNPNGDLGPVGDGDALACD